MPCTHAIAPALIATFCIMPSKTLPTRCSRNCGFRSSRPGRHTSDGQVLDVVYRIAHNKIIDWYRFCRAAAEFEVELGDDPEDLAAGLSSPQADNPDALLERAELANRIVAALEALPAVQRDAFLMAVEGE